MPNLSNGENGRVIDVYRRYARSLRSQATLSMAPGRSAAQQWPAVGAMPLMLAPVHASQLLKQTPAPGGRSIPDAKGLRTNAPGAT